MKIVGTHQYRVRENWLHFLALNLDPIRIPFGLGLSTKRSASTGKTQSARTPPLRPRLRLQAKGRQITVLDAEVGGSWRRVLPLFSRTVDGATGRGPTFLIQTAAVEAERLAAHRIVTRAHYLKARDRGLILLALIEDPLKARKIRSRWWSKLPRVIKKRYGTLERATGGTGRIVGALHLERLVHGHPLGRAAIYQWDRKRAPGARSTRRPGFRWRVVRELGLYWISRIAVDPPFQELGIGSALCDAAREVAASRMLEPGRYVELIRRLPIAQFEAIAGGKSDFLTGHSKVFATRLPFKLRTPYLSRKPGRTWNAAIGRWGATPRDGSDPPKRGLSRLLLRPGGLDGDWTQHTPGKTRETTLMISEDDYIIVECVLRSEVLRYRTRSLVREEAEQKVGELVDKVWVQVRRDALIGTYGDYTEALFGHDGANALAQLHRTTEMATRIKPEFSAADLDTGSLPFRLELQAKWFKEPRMGLQHLIHVLCGDIFGRAVSDIRGSVEVRSIALGRLGEELQAHYRTASHDIKSIRALFNLDRTPLLYSEEEVDGSLPLLAFSVKPRNGLAPADFKRITEGVLRAGFNIVEADVRNIDFMDATWRTTFEEIAKTAIAIKTHVARFSLNLSGPADLAIQYAQKFQALHPADGPWVVKVDGGLDGI